MVNTVLLNTPIATAEGWLLSLKAEAGDKFDGCLNKQLLSNAVDSTCRSARKCCNLCSTSFASRT
eukprot:SAG25_NODE_474_length_7638_cov_5.842962_6_plen_65_part_00